MDNRLLSDGDLQWQAQLLANYSGHIFIPRASGNDPAHLLQNLIESSLVILALRAELSDLKSKNSTLVSENKRLEAEVERMEDEHDRERQRIIQSYRFSTPVAPTQVGTSNPSMESQVAPYHFYRPPATFHHIGENSRSLVHSSPFDNRHPLPHGDDYAFAEQMQIDLLVSDQQSAQLAAQSQHDFDEEDRLLRSQRNDLARTAQRQFQCRVCFEEQPEDSVARLDRCGHCFCRDCIKGHVSSKLAENRYPILCPVCMTEEGSGDPGGVLLYSVLNAHFPLNMYFSGHKCSRSTDWYLGEAVRGLGSARNGRILGPRSLSEVSAPGHKSRSLSQFVRY